MKAKKDRVLTVKFNADIAATMRWNFRPQQSEVKLFAGETALAFYTAKNPSTKPIDGISTYNVVPFEAGQVSYLCFFSLDIVNYQRTLTFLPSQKSKQFPHFIK